MNHSTELVKKLKEYEGGDNRKAVFQLITTLSLYLAFIAGMFVMVLSGLPYWMVLIAALPAGGLHMKIFITMHDCGHNSYLTSTRWMRIVGRICAVITFTPYYDWLRAHAIHHATVSDLDKRGTGDVWTMTVEEYQASSRGKKILYRIYRNPFFLLGLGPLLLFLVVFRFPRNSLKKRCLKSVLCTDLAVAVIIAAFSLTVGFGTYLRVILPTLFVAGVSGVWLFFIQHQYKDVYWAHSSNWNSIRAALEGSSFYRLPGVLRWFSGNIGYHHIHHLNPRIPNYALKRCYNEVPEVQRVKPITLKTSLKSLFLHLWDEKSRTLVKFRNAGPRRSKLSPI
ncbi:MAG: fatty acid desaturase [Spirochaetaceae bacterium]|nr:fatty acid desaturase [Spirochaetaceae bacterium]MDT8297141.1 fatty acid desaturase [Spirochaetaceae bacterium]